MYGAQQLVIMTLALLFWGGGLLAVIYTLISLRDIKQMIRHIAENLPKNIDS